jgi:hypothetical protein
MYILSNKNLMTSTSMHQVERMKAVQMATTSKNTKKDLHTMI